MIKYKKSCQECFKTFTKGPKEGNYRWDLRKYCSNECFLKADKRRTWSQ